MEMDFDYGSLSFYIKPIARLTLMIVFVISSISIALSWTSCISAACLIASYIFFKTKPEVKPKEEYIIREWNFANPFKGKTGNKQIDDEKEKEFNLALSDYLLYDATETRSVKQFESMKKNSDCVFAKKSQVWGSADYNEDISLEDNIKSLYPTFLKFISQIQSHGIDAFVIELPGHLYGKTIKVFSDAVRRTLLTLKTRDNIRRYNKTIRLFPNAAASSLPSLTEDMTRWNRKFWVYEIHCTTFFITTFAPFYPETNSRYNHSLPDCYILFQPELSFAIHDLPTDTATTNWLHPVTVRDKIRKAFHENGREYTPPMVENEPMVYEMVKRIEPEDDPIMWWIAASQPECKR